jgi:hypothetical protein
MFGVGLGIGFTAGILSLLGAPINSLVIYGIYQLISYFLYTFFYICLTVIFLNREKIVYNKEETTYEAETM